MLNHIVLMGRLTRDPELRHTGNGTAVASFSLAVDRGLQGPVRREGDGLRGHCGVALHGGLRE